MTHHSVIIETPTNSHHSITSIDSHELSLTYESFLEMIGTFFFVYISLAGVHQAVLSSLTTNSPVDQLHIAICFALGLTSGIVLALKSGAHLNTSVSFTFWLDGQITIKKFIYYTCAQFIGSCLAALLVLALYYSRIDKFEHSNALVGSFGTLKDSSNSLFASVLDQFIGSALLMFGIMKAPDNKFKPLIIGTILGTLGLFQGSNGFAFNFARDMAPRIISSIIYESNPFTFEHYWFWVPMLIPFIGMPFGYILSKLI